MPIPLGLPPQCGFVDRCTEAIEGRCEGAVPALVEVSDDHWVCCFLHNDDKEPDHG